MKHSHVLTLPGDSHRLRETPRSRLFRPLACGSALSGIRGAPPPPPDQEA
jgi:hypothetical protein